jgi:hypothetical protein
MRLLDDNVLTGGLFTFEMILVLLRLLFQRQHQAQREKGKER